VCWRYHLWQLSAIPQLAQGARSDRRLPGYDTLLEPGNGYLWIINLDSTFLGHVRIAIFSVLLAWRGDDSQNKSFLCSVEKDMKRFGSHPYHEKCPLYEGPPPQGLTKAQRGGSFLNFSHRSAAQEAPTGRRQSSYMMDRVVTIPASYLNTTIFLGNHWKNQNNALGVTGKRCLRPNRWDSPHGAIVPNIVHENYTSHQIFLQSRFLLHF
jgi:hypothetical protein